MAMKDGNVQIVPTAGVPEPIRIGTATNKHLLSREDYVTLRVPCGYLEITPQEGFALIKALMNAIFACGGE